MRGEHCPTESAWDVKCGSSPHAGGTRPYRGCWRGPRRFIPTCVGNTGAQWVLEAYGRFIPTCVGNTGIRRSPWHRGPVHPHMRGEHGRLPCVFPRVYGSSPHAWGTPVPHGTAHYGIRFIPTCVGNTFPGKRWRWSKTVHPHMRGEHLYFIQVEQKLFGSSPHAWGTRVPVKLKLMVLRFIPTCVGNT